MQKNTIWIFIWRLNPPHIWHVKILEKSLKENSKTILFLWSSNIIDENNPFSFEERKNFLYLILKKEVDENKLIITNIDDVPDDKIWVENIWKKIFEVVWNTENKLNFYFWDFENDYAYKAIKEFEKYLWFRDIYYNLLSRENSQIEGVPISSTNIRKMLKNWQYELVKKFIDEKIFEKIIEKFDKKHK